MCSLHIYAAGVTAGGSVGASLFGYAYGGATITSKIVEQRSSVILAWPVDDILQVRDFTPACTLTSHHVQGLQVESYWWWQASSVTPWCLLFSSDSDECPGVFELQNLVEDGSYDCCSVSVQQLDILHPS